MPACACRCACACACACAAAVEFWRACRRTPLRISNGKSAERTAHSPATEMIKNVSFETQRVCERARVAAQLLPLRELRRLLGASSRSQLVAIGPLHKPVCRALSRTWTVRGKSPSSESADERARTARTPVAPRSTRGSSSSLIAHRYRMGRGEQMETPCDLCVYDTHGASGQANWSASPGP